MTGATGFLGGRVARALLARGEKVRLLHRPGREGALKPAVPDGASGRVTSVPGDLQDAGSLQKAMEGCRAVVHAAALVSRSGSRELFEDVNVGGLRRVVEAAVEAGVKRIVYTSSFFALGPSDGRSAGDAGLDETALSDTELDFDLYQWSKQRAALLARELTDDGAPLVTLYPGTIVGPGPLTEGNFITGLMRDHLSGRLVPLPLGGTKRWSFVHVEDVAAGHLAALDASEPRASYVLGGDNVGMAALFRDLEAISRVAPPRLSAPYPVLWLTGLAEEAGQALFGRAPTQLTRGAARLLRREWMLDSSAAKRDLGYSPRALGAVLQDTLSWLIREGHVPALPREARS